MGSLSRAGHAARIVAAALALLVLTAAYTWPLPIHAATAIPHDAGDPLLVTWILWWSTHVMPLTARWWNAPAFYPATGVFAFSENLLGLAPLTAPILWSGGAPLLAYNVAFLASFLLSGLGAYFLGYVLTRQHGAAFVAAIAFAFSPYRLSHLNHLQLLSSYWMPVALGALHLYARDGRRRWALLFGASWLLQALACGYYFFFLSLLIVCWGAWFGRRWTLRRAAVAVTVWVLAAVLMAPLLLGYKRIQDAYGFKRVPSEIAYYSADVAGLATAAPESLVWHRFRAIDKPESALFPGVTLLLLCAGGIVASIRKRRNGFAAGGREASDAGSFRFYTWTAVLMWLLALGPAPAFKGRALGIAGLYSILMYVPGFNGMRVPARLWMVSVVCLSAAAAIVVARIDNQRMRRFVMVAALAGLLLDGWPSPIALAKDPGMQITRAEAVARLGLPLTGNETETMYGAIAQDRPVFNGYSGYTAPQHRALADLLDRGDRRIFDRLAATGPVEVIVRHDLDPDGRWRQFVAGVTGARVTGQTSDWTAFLIPESAAHVPALPAGRPLRVVHVEASVNNKDVNAVLDGDLDTRWHSDRQDGGETIVVDLGSPERPADVTLSLGTYSGQYPRTIEASLSADGAHWTPVWTGDTALLTYDGAVRYPRRVPIAVPLPKTPARYIRLRQVAADPSRAWTIVELEVHE